MAVDTRAKRASALRMGYVFPIDGSIDAADRLAATWMYSGIATSLPIIGSIVAFVLTINPMPLCDLVINPVPSFNLTIIDTINLDMEI